MNFNEYQKLALTTALHHSDEQMDKTIWVLGIAGEAGEVVEKWKKIVAYHDGKITEDDKQEIKKELGDVLWYIALLTDSLGMTLEEVVKLNIDKLASRKQRDQIKGRGDNR